MIKLRELLDNHKIEWVDISDEFNLVGGGKLGIDRIHFKVKGKKFSVINGFGTYGGYTLGEENEGLLELYDFCSEPIGYLTAEQVLKEINKKFS